MNEGEIVSRSVILRKCSPHAPHQTADGKIKPGGTVLALIVSVRRKLQRLAGFGFVDKNVSRCPIDISVSLPAPLIVKATFISYTSKNQAMTYAICSISIL